MATPDRIKQWRSDNPDKVRATVKKYYLSHREECNERSRKWKANNPEKVKEYKKTQVAEKSNWKEWAKNNPDKVRANWKRQTEIVRSNPVARLNRNIKTKMCRSLHGIKGNRHWENLVGFTVDHLKQHLEKLFTAEMTWENYGTYWHIDHKIPIAVFNYGNPEDIDFRLCWSLKNLQPLESKQNMIKNSRIDKPFQPSLAMEVVL